MRKGLPLGAGIVAVVLGVSAVVCYNLGPSSIETTASFQDVLVALTFGPTGALLAIREPESPIGWIFCWMGILSGLSGFGSTYAGLALVGRPGELPLGGLAVWVSAWTWILSLGAVIFLFQLFPTGHYLSRRWRRAALVGGGAVVGSAVIEAMVPFESSMPGYPAHNPIGMLSENSIEPVLVVLLLCAMAGLVTSFASLVVRFRRSEGDERAQMKWLAFAGSILVVVLTLSVAGVEQVDSNRVVQGFEVLSAPVAIGIAILKYRLYDIDVVINRTLVYGSLSAVLAGSYLLLVVALQAILPTGGNQLAVAGSTLTVAGLFNPLRTRVQSFIDRRFYRSRYDATATLDSFSTRLRDQVDLESLRDELVTVVGSTMHPTHVHLWLRDEARTEGEETHAHWT